MSCRTVSYDPVQAGGTTIKRKFSYTAVPTTRGYLVTWPCERTLCTKLSTFFYFFIVFYFDTHLDITSNLTYSIFLHIQFMTETLRDICELL